MSKRDNLLESIAKTTEDYRSNELDPPTPEHVGRWVRQFDEGAQEPILCEMDHVLKTTYLSKKCILKFLAGLAKSKNLAGENPCDFWRKVNFLCIQQQGHSQTELLSLFDTVLEKDYKFNTSGCGASEDIFVYLDDAMFSGNRVGNDLEKWIRETELAQATVYVIVVVIHKLAEWQIRERLESAIKEAGKSIKIQYKHLFVIENRKFHKENAGVLWPTNRLPDDNELKAYIESHPEYPFEPRPPGGNLGPFSSEDGRQLLEREFTLAGVHIQNFSDDPSDILRPLGYSPFGLGFGSMIVTFRNCPNNCPLALWWGDPDASSSHPLSKWYPLFPRKTYD